MPLHGSLLGSSNSNTCGLNDEKMDIWLGHASHVATVVGIWFGMFASECEVGADTMHKWSMAASVMSCVASVMVKGGYKKGSFGMCDGTTGPAKKLRYAGLWLHVCAIAASLVVAYLVKNPSGSSDDPPGVSHNADDRF